MYHRLQLKDVKQVVVQQGGGSVLEDSLDYILVQPLVDGAAGTYEQCLSYKTRIMEFFLQRGFAGRIQAIVITDNACPRVEDSPPGDIVYKVKLSF